MTDGRFLTGRNADNRSRLPHGPVEEVDLDEDFAVLGWEALQASRLASVSLRTSAIVVRLSSCRMFSSSVLYTFDRTG